MFEKMEYVYAVYKEKSFTKAAEKLYISQPCLSAAIKKIEEEIGMPIFERRYSAVSLTEIGEKYVEAAEKIRNITQDFQANVNSMKNLASGSLTVGVPNYVMSYIIPRIVVEYTRLYPGIQVSLEEASTVSLREKLHADQIDLMVDSFDEESAQYEYWTLTDEEILLAVPAFAPCNHGLEKYRMTPEEIYSGIKKTADMPQIELKCFREEKFILLKNGNSMYTHASRAFRDCGFEPQINFWLDQLSTSYALAASGNGVCFVTDTMFKFHHFHDAIYLYKIRGGGRRSLSIAKKKSRYSTGAILKFVELFQARL